MDALKLACKRLEKSPSTMSDLSSVLIGIGKARGINIDNIPVVDIKRRHIISLLDYCKATNDRFSGNRYNKYKAYLGMLFKELKKIQTNEQSPIDSW